MLSPHPRLNLTQLVRRLYALPGVDRYLVCSGCQRASLWRWDRGGPEALGGPLIRLKGDVPPQGEAPAEDRGLALLLVLPLGWVRGLIPAASAPPLASLAAAGGERVGLRHLPPVAGGAESSLGRLVQQHRRQLQPHPTLPDAIERLRLERLLERCLAPGSVELLDLPLPRILDAWLAELPLAAEGLAADLVALLHLLPPPQQAPLAEALAARIALALAAPGPVPDPLPWMRLLEALVGGLNSRDPRLAGVAEGLRALGLERARCLADPADRGLVLMRLLQLPAMATDGDLALLAEAIDTLVQAIGRSSAAGDRPLRRQQQGALETILRAAGPNLLLLRALVPVLTPETCYRLPFLQPPSVGLLLLKGALLQDGPAVAALDGEQRKALVALVERILPRIWWQQPLLLRLLHDLRRFPLDLAWLRQQGVLLTGIQLLHSRGLPPLEPQSGLPKPEEPADPQRLLRTQVLLLLRLQPALDERAGLLRLAAAAGKPPLLRLLDGEDEEAPVMAAAAGLSDRSAALALLAAERRGVPALLPPLHVPAALEQAYGAILEHWRAVFVDGAPRPQAPIAVVITTHAPRLGLLRQALESLALQTLQPQEVWLVDDGTPQPLAEALADQVGHCRRELALPLRLLRREDNGGQYRCRNLALAAMDAEVLVIQDDDDLSHPLRLARQWEALQRGRAAVYSRHLRLDQDTAAPQADGDGGAFFGDGITTLMVARSTALELGGFYPVRSRGDVEFRSRLQRRFGSGQVERLEQPLYLMRGAASTISSHFEYGCSLSLPGWRRLMEREVLV